MLIEVEDDEFQVMTLSVGTKLLNKDEVDSLASKFLNTLALLAGLGANFWSSSWPCLSNVPAQANLCSRLIPKQ